MRRKGSHTAREGERGGEEREWMHERRDEVMGGGMLEGTTHWRERGREVTGNYRLYI